MSISRFTIRFLSTNNSVSKSKNLAFNCNSLLNNKKRILTTPTSAANNNTIFGNEYQSSRSPYYQQFKNFSSLQNKHYAPMALYEGQRSLVTHEINKNLTLFSDKPRNVDRDPKSLRLKQPIEGPLVIIFSWLLAKKKHLGKYAKIYTDQGFDVLTVEITPWQLLWPVKGAQLVAAETLKFIENNATFEPIVVHGFSVGAYVWGEVLVNMATDTERYKVVIQRIVAQIWDSSADITEIPVGLPKAIFPKNPTLQKALRNYAIYHLKTFHEQATSHYIRASQIFHSTIVKVPALFFLSKSDPIGAEKSNLNVKETFESMGIKVTWKCWERSPHVLHYQKNPEEYQSYLLKHLQDNVMEKIAQKSRAKL